MYADDVLWKDERERLENKVSKWQKALESKILGY
jgi:hypothetical protein